MQIREIMSTKPEIITPQTTLQEAAEKMRELDCGFLPVGANDRLQGMVTDRDIAIRAIAEGRDPKETPVSEIMTEKVLYCFEEDDLRDAARSMKEQQVRRLVVLNNRQDKRLTGVVSLGDIATRCGDEKLAGDITEAVSEKAA